MRSLVLAVLVACGQPSKPAPMSPSPTNASSDPTCPLEVPGTSVSVEDTSDGAALVFVTTGNPSDVQTRADAFVAAHGAATGNSFAAMVAHNASASVQRMAHGAKLVFTGSDPASIQSELRMHADHLSAGSCAMAM